MIWYQVSSAFNIGLPEGTFVVCDKDACDLPVQKPEWVTQTWRHPSGLRYWLEGEMAEWLEALPLGYRIDHRGMAWYVGLRTKQAAMLFKLTWVGT